MLKKGKPLSLAEKISSVLNAVPESLDPEDQRDDTTAKLGSFDEGFDGDDDDEKLLSKFRKQNIDLLADVDLKYAGRKSNRQNFEDFDSGSEIDEGEHEASSQSGGSEEIQEIDDEFENSDIQTSEQDITESTSDNYPIDPFDNENLSKSDFADSNFKHLNETNVSTQVSKGFAVRNQMNIWENLLEVRIQLQKMLLTANKMPQKDYYNEIEEESGVDFTAKVEEAKNNITNVLNKMLAYQKLMVRNYPETKNLVKGTKKKEMDNDTDDEEIPSDTDEEDIKSNSENGDSESSEDKFLKRKRKLEELESDMNEFHNSYKEYRNSTIEKWNSKTRLFVAKSSGQTHSVLNQIQHVLNDKEKLFKKTQLNRAGFKILMPEKDAPMGENEDAEEYNPEIFDDTDFYHQLLRELIEVKSADVTDPIQLGRQWIQLQNLRSKMKKKVDTKASKGRKIRYAVHTKLVNFMAPFDNYSWTEEAKNELFGSLFGKNQPKNYFARVFLVVCAMKLKEKMAAENLIKSGNEKLSEEIAREILKKELTLEAQAMINMGVQRTDQLCIGF